MKSSLKRVLLDWLPPAALRGARSALDRIRPAPFEYVGSEWPDGPIDDGWAAEGVARARERRWHEFLETLETTEPPGMAAGDLVRPWHLDTATQTLYVTFAYCLALAGRHSDPVRVLDWGGELGSYLHVARKLQPDVPFEWHCADLPVVIELGRRLNPDVIFHGDDGWKEQTYDFVFSSSSLQYLPDWRPTVRDLVASASEWLYLTRMPFVTGGPGFVALQRVREYGTQVYGWVLNRGEFVGYVEGQGMQLVQSFVNHVGPRIQGAPEQNIYMGFLFRRPPRSGTGSGNATETSRVYRHPIKRSAP